MWPRRNPLGLDARDLKFGRHEVGRVIHLEVDLGVGAIDGSGLLQAEV